MTNKLLEGGEKEPHQGQPLTKMIKDCLGAVIYMIETVFAVLAFLIKKLKPLVINLFYLIEKIIEFLIRIISLSIVALKIGAEKITGALLNFFLSVINFGTAWFKHRTPKDPVEKAGQGSVAKSLQKTGGSSYVRLVPDRRRGPDDASYSPTRINEDPNLFDDIECADALVPEVERLYRDIERMISKQVKQSVDRARICAELAVSDSPAATRDDLGVYDTAAPNH